MYNSAGHVRADDAGENDTLLIVFFPPETKLNVPSIRIMVDFAKEARSSHFIIVYRDKITTFAKNFIVNYSAEKRVTFESFQIASLQYNILEHELVPPHRILRKEEEKDVMHKFRARRKTFPILMVKDGYGGAEEVDPVAKFLGLKIGQMVEITRDHPSGFRYHASPRRAPRPCAV